MLAPPEDDQEVPGEVAEASDPAEVVVEVRGSPEAGDDLPGEPQDPQAQSGTGEDNASMASRSESQQGIVEELEELVAGVSDLPSDREDLDEVDPWVYDT